MNLRLLCKSTRSTALQSHKLREDPGNDVRERRGGANREVDWRLVARLYKSSVEMVLDEEMDHIQLLKIQKMMCVFIGTETWLDDSTQTLLSSYQG